MSSVAALVAIGVASAALLYHATVIAPRRLRVTHVDAPIRGLPTEFDGFTIVALGDLHCGSSPQAFRHLERAVELAQQAKPDLVALLGDYGLTFRRFPRGSARSLRDAAPVLERCLGSLRATHGTVAILGNHDYDVSIERVREILKGAGARVLSNEYVCLTRGDATLAVSGVGDLKCGVVDPRAGLDGVSDGTPRIVLTHNPDGVLAFERGIRVDLALAGHTHGGQVVLPVIGALARHCSVCDRDCATGWVRRSPVPLYVTAGVGSVIPIRIGSAPEVLVVRLRAVSRPSRD